MVVRSGSGGGIGENGGGARGRGIRREVLVLYRIRRVGQPAVGTAVHHYRCSEGGTRQGLDTAVSRILRKQIGNCWLVFWFIFIIVEL